MDQETTAIFRRRLHRTRGQHPRRSGPGLIDKGKHGARGAIRLWLVLLFAWLS